jgi:type VI secretion system protein ImpG
MPSEIPILLFWNDLAHTCTVQCCIANMPEPPRFLAVDSKTGNETEIEIPPGLRTRNPLEYQPMLSAGKKAFPGFRMMREFFSLPQRFMQIVMTGLDRCEELQEADTLVIELILPLAPKDLPPFEPKNFMLFTSAVCNEWIGSSKPIVYEGTKEAFPLEADYTAGAEILRILGVRMLKRGAESFTKVEKFDYYNQDVPSYSTGSETYQLSGTQRSVRWRLDLNNLGLPGEQVVVTADLALANADAHEALGSRAALSSYEGVPEELSAITIAPSTEFTPSLEAEGQYWQLVDMIASNLSSMTDALRLQKFLLHLNRTDNKVIASAIRGIRNVDLRMKTTTLKQQPVKTASMTIDIERSEFLNDGFTEIFFEAFYVFLTEFVPLNSFLELMIRDIDTKEIVCSFVDHFSDSRKRMQEYGQGKRQYKGAFDSWS